MGRIADNHAGLTLRRVVVLQSTATAGASGPGLSRKKADNGNTSQGIRDHEVREARSRE
jgi:hypothetical protein